jgi:hypothetical protein
VARDINSLQHGVTVFDVTGYPWDIGAFCDLLMMVGLTL